MVPLCLKPCLKIYMIISLQLYVSQPLLLNSLPFILVNKVDVIVLSFTSSWR